VMQSEVDEGLG